MPTAVASPTVLQKAERILAEGRITELPVTRLFEVVGDQGTAYRVTVFPKGDSHAATCTCPAHGACKHLIAVAMQIQREGKS
jgi:uncharacterized Zn finger protein